MGQANDRPPRAEQTALFGDRKRGRLSVSGCQQACEGSDRVQRPSGRWGLTQLQAPGRSGEHSTPSWDCMSGQVAQGHRMAKQLS